MWYMDMWHDGDWGWGMWVMPLIWFLVLAAIVVGVVLVVRALDRGRPATVAQTATVHPRVTASDDAHEILRRRYAAGEIERDEYLRKLDDLGP